MSSNPRNIVSGLKSKTVISNSDPTVTPQVFGIPRSSDYVKTTKSGFLANKSLPVLESVNVATIDTDADAKLYYDYQIVRGGTYFNLLNTIALVLDPSWITPERRLIIATSNQATRTFAFPSATNLITFLRNIYGVENIVAGLSWEIDFLNYSAAPNTSMSIVNTTTGVSIYGNTVASSYFDYSTGVTNVKNNLKMRFVLTSVEDTVANPYAYSVYSV